MVLPIKNARRIAVIGENAVKMMTVGGGSSSLKAQHETSPRDGIRARFQGMAEVVYERGYVGDVTGEYNGVVTGQDLRDSRTEQQLIDDAVAQAKTADYVIFIGGLSKSPHQDTEEFDPESLDLPYGQDKVIEAHAAANENLIVVNISGNAVAMPWVKKVLLLFRTGISAVKSAPLWPMCLVVTSISQVIFHFLSLLDYKIQYLRIRF